MKKNVLIIAGIAGLFLSNQPVNAQDKGDILVAMGTRGGPAFVINTRPDFVYLSDSGFYVSYGSPYDMLFYGDLYYLYWGGNWYSSYYYNGPWNLIREFNLPVIIRSHRWIDIRRFRDDEYRRHDRKYWDNQFQFDRQRFGGPRIHGPGQGPVGPPPPPLIHGGPSGQPPLHINSGTGPSGGNPPPPPLTHGGPPALKPLHINSGTGSSGGNPPPPPGGNVTQPPPGGNGNDGSPPPAGTGGTPPNHEDRHDDNLPGNGRK